MSLTIINKSDLSKIKRNPKIALVLAGGAISGGAFKLGGLVALNRFLKNKKVTDFDIYIGVSAGAFLSAFVSSGIEPEELLKAINGKSLRIKQFKPFDFYNLNTDELIKKFYLLFKDIITLWPSIGLTFLRYIPHHRTSVLKNLAEFINNPTYGNFELIFSPVILELLNKIPHPSRYIPSGIFDNSTIEKFVREGLVSNHLPNNFKLLFKERNKALYISATNLNTSGGVIFGHDSDYTLTISEAVQASTAIPAFYKPVKIRGEEYIDGGVRKTVNISLAVHKGADFIIIYNPFRPFVNLHRYQLNPTYESIGDLGLFAILNQALRTALHTRLFLGLDKIRLDNSFKGDLILLEPTETDAEFFSLNPLAFWHREISAQHGYFSVKQTLERNFYELKRIFNAYALEVDLQELQKPIDDIYKKESSPPLQRKENWEEKKEKFKVIN